MVRDSSSRSTVPPAHARVRRSRAPCSSCTVTSWGAAVAAGAIRTISRRRAGRPSREPSARTENQDLGVEAYYIQMRVRPTARSSSTPSGSARPSRSSRPARTRPAPRASGWPSSAIARGTISTRVYLRSRQADLSADFPGEIALDPRAPARCPGFVASGPAQSRAPRGCSSRWRAADPAAQRRREAAGLHQLQRAAGHRLQRVGSTAPRTASGRALRRPGNRASGTPVADGTLFVVSLRHRRPGSRGRRQLKPGQRLQRPAPQAGEEPRDECGEPRHRRAGAERTHRRASEVHRATVKHAEVICRALYTVVNHRARGERGAAAAPPPPTAIRSFPSAPRSRWCSNHSWAAWRPRPAPPVRASRGCCGTPPRSSSTCGWRSRGLQGPDRHHLFPDQRDASTRAPGPGDTLVPVQPDVARPRRRPGEQCHHVQWAHRDGRRAAVRHPAAPGRGRPAGDRGPEPQYHPLHRRPAERQSRRAGARPGAGDRQPARRRERGHPTLLAQPIDTYGVRIHTIGIGPGVVQPSQTILGTIATTTGGVSRFDMDAAALRQFFTMSLMDALAASSPQLVAYRRGTLAGRRPSRHSPSPPACRQGRAPAELAARLRRLDLRVEKDGVDVTASSRTITGPFYRIFSIALPAGAVRAGGEWRLRIRGQRGIAYQARGDPSTTIAARPTRASPGRDHRAGDALESPARTARRRPCRARRDGDRHGPAPHRRASPIC